MFGDRSPPLVSGTKDPYSGFEEKPVIQRMRFKQCGPFLGTNHAVPAKRYLPVHMVLRGLSLAVC